MELFKDKINYLSIFIISLILVLDLFIHGTQPATFDGPTHINAIAQYYRALKAGDFPVVWADGYANYGMPLGLFAHQVTNYLGGALSFVIPNFILTYNIVLFLGVFLSSLFFYLFLRKYFTPLISFAGVVLFNFAPYRIINIYIRGAMPEVFSGIFLPLILIGLYNFVKKEKTSGLVLLIISLALLLLTHPMLFLIYAFIFVPYFIFLLYEKKHEGMSKKSAIKMISLFITAVVLSIGIGAYYIVPLELETKYLVYSHESFKIPLDEFLTWNNFFNPQWYYFYHHDIYYRGHFIKTGVLEILSVFIGGILILYNWFIKKERKISILHFAVVTGIVVVFLTLPFSSFFYNHIKLLVAIQFPWRMLSAFIFIPPLIFCYLSKNIRATWFIAVCIIVFSIQYIPQLYGKNYTYQSQQDYLFTPINLFGPEKNTLWTGKTENYPIKKRKYDVIEGKGNVLSAEVKNSSRKYLIDASTPLRMVDYTFYFPGWNVLVDDQPVNIQFQDPSYRGVITYMVPSGRHTVQIIFEDTKIRLISKIISIISILGLLIFVVFVKKVRLLKN